MGVGAGNVEEWGEEEQGTREVIREALMNANGAV